MMIRTLAAALCLPPLCPPAICLPGPRAGGADDPYVHAMPESLDAYADDAVHGFACKVNTALAERDPELLATVRLMLASDLAMIEHVVPAPAYAALTRVTFWIELQGPVVDPGMSGRGMCYHASREWVTRNGLLGEKAGGVEICSASDFIDWRRNQPFMTLHELAHAYHHMLGVDYAPVADAYEHARAAGLYDKVMHNNSVEPVRAYAMNNATEYFSELTEAYFGLNDFEPFTRAQLRDLDPQGFAAVERAWNLSAEQIARARHD
jgi:hypothetical protein